VTTGVLGCAWVASLRLLAAKGGAVF